MNDLTASIGRHQTHSIGLGLPPCESYTVPDEARGDMSLDRTQTFLAVLVCLLGWSGAAEPANAQILGYSGPSILTRGARPFGRGQGEPVRFRGYATLGATYSSGLTSAATDEKGDLFNQASEGAFLGFGVYGSQRGRRSQAAVSYSGSYILFNNRRYYSGPQQSFGISYGSQLARRLNFFISAAAAEHNQVAGTTRNPFSTEQIAILDYSTEVFDSHMFGVSSMAGFSYQKSARMQFSFGGGVHISQRRSKALVSSQGYSAMGEMSYAVSRRTSMGVGYQWGQFFFKNNYGQSNYMSYAGNLSRVLNGRWSLGMSAGMYTTDSERVQTILIDPVIAKLIGQTSTASIVRNKVNGVSASAGVTGAFRRNGVTFGYFRGIMPGNGVFLTSEGQSVTAAITHSGSQRWNVGASSGYYRMKSLFDYTGRSLGGFESYGGGAGFSYRLFSFVHFTASGDLRHSETSSLRFLRNRDSVSVGLAFSPGELPLRLF